MDYGYFASRTVSEIIDLHASEKPTEIAFVAADSAMTWRQYKDWSDKLAGILIDCGFEKGERLGILLPDSCEIHVAFVACEKSGVIGVGISARAARQEIVHLLEISKATALLSLSKFRDMELPSLYTDLLESGLPLRACIELRGSIGKQDSIWVNNEPWLASANPSLPTLIEGRRSRLDEIFLLNSTSGTTGMPKCVAQQQSRWFNFARVVLDSAPLTSRDRILSAVPASSGFGLWSAHFLPAVLGATTILLPKFSPEILLDEMQRQEVSVLAAVGTQLIMLINAPDFKQRDFRPLRTLYTGGEIIPYEKAAQFEDITGATVLQFYGSNEAGAISGTTVRDPREKRFTTSGRIIDGLQVRLISESGEDVTTTGVGQPVCKSNLLSKGYFNNAEANDELYYGDGFMKIGDIVSIDGEGYLKVIGRVGDFIIRGGKNISAAGVEAAVLGHPNIKMAAAVSMPDAVFGEKVCVFAVSVDGSPIDHTELVSFLKNSGVSTEYFPERLITVSELPMSSGGKVSKRMLRDSIRNEIGGGRH